MQVFGWLYFSIIYNWFVVLVVVVSVIALVVMEVVVVVVNFAGEVALLIVVGVNYVLRVGFVLLFYHLPFAGCFGCCGGGGTNCGGN